MTKNTELKEVLDLEELDQVSGGTLDEVYELAGAFCQKGGTCGKVIGGALDAVKGAGIGRLAGPFNIALSGAVGNGLNQLGIKSDMSVGVVGTGLFASKNSYSLNGKSLSQSEVLSMIHDAEVV